MKILCVIDDLGSGGAQRQLVTLACALKERGHVVEFFTYHSDDHYAGALRRAQIEVICCPKRSRWSLAPIFDLRRHYLKFRPDVVLAFLETPSFYAEIVKLTVCRMRLVVSERSSYPAGQLNFGKRLLQIAHRIASSITVNSHHQLLRMQAEFPWMKNKCSLVYNGYDLQTWKPTSERFRSRGDARLLVLGSVVENKNPLNVARALDICRRRFHLDVNISWAGRIDNIDPTLGVYERTNQYLARSGLSQYWRWLGVRDDVSTLLSEHDALMHAAFLEGLPNAVCEALACGRPVLCSDIGDHRFLVKDGTNGFLFDPQSPGSIADCIRSFCELPEDRRAQMGHAARAFALEYLSVERYAEEYERVFEGLGARADSVRGQVKN